LYWATCRIPAAGRENGPLGFERQKNARLTMVKFWLELCPFVIEFRWSLASMAQETRLFT
jgi:hypothetical protein